MVDQRAGESPVIPAAFTPAHNCLLPDCSYMRNKAAMERWDSDACS